jgi:hypothetical protein
MNKKLFKQLCMNFNKDADKELYELWNYNLRCYNEDEMQKAVSVIISQDKYFPTLKRILEVVKDIILKESFLKDKTKYKNTNWYNKEIINEPIDKETQKYFEDFNNFIEEFRK